MKLKRPPNVILSGVFLDEGEKNAVEGSPDIHRTAKRPEILRLRKTPSGRLAPLRMTW